MCLLLVLSACGEPEPEASYAERRTAPPLSGPVSELSHAERFGAVQRAPSVAREGPDAPLSWSAPQGWRELAPTQMRMANFQVGEEGECYLTILGGSGGGIAGNVNRWRGQMGLGELSDEQIEALPRMGILGRDAYRIELAGAYRGMGTVGKEGWALLGAITGSERFTIFVKFIGPSALIEQESAAFDAFCSSLALKEAAAPASHEHAPMSSSGAAGAGGLAWDVPAGWDVEPGSGMRLVTFRSDEVECVVVVLGGDGGGVVSNFQRWVKQLGQDEPTEEEVAAMPTAQAFGVSVPLLDAVGEYTGMGAAESVPDTRMLGLACVLQDRAVFVKMLGPNAQVAAQRQNFLAFAESLRLAGGG